MQLAPRGERLEDVAIAGREARQAEDGDLRREVDDARVGLEHLAGPFEPLGGPRLADARPQAAPEPSLPLLVRRVLGRGPGPHGVGPVQRVPVEELGHMPDRREPTRSLERIGVLRRPSEMRGEQMHPRLVQALVDDLEQRPDGPLRKPRVRLRLYARRGRHRRPDEPARRRELHVRADPVGLAVGRPEPSRQLLRDPPLHAPSGTATTSRANGSSAGAASSARSASTSPSARLERWRWSIGRVRSLSRGDVRWVAARAWDLTDERAAQLARAPGQGGPGPSIVGWSATLAGWR